MLRSFAPWLIKAVISASYWLTAFYVAVGLFSGDRVTAVGIVPDERTEWAARPFVVCAILLWAALSYLFDRAVAARRP